MWILRWNFRHWFYKKYERFSLEKLVYLVTDEFKKEENYSLCRFHNYGVVDACNLDDSSN